MHRHAWRFSALFSSDPRTLTPEVCHSSARLRFNCCPGSMKTKLLLSQILFLLNSLLAEDASHLSLSEVTRVAVAHNPSIAEARQKWEAARKRVVQEGAWDDLRVSANSVTTRFVDIA